MELLLIAFVLFGYSNGLPCETPPTFGPSYGDSQLALADDTSTQVTLSTPILFFGQTYTVININNNGVVSFSGTFSAWQTQVFPRMPRTRLLAPFWSDVDTTNDSTGASGGRVYWRQDVVNGRTRLIVTWDRVRAYQRTTASGVNSFQVVLTSRPDRASGAFDIVFNYLQPIKWLSGMADTTQMAVCGYDAGDGVYYYNMPGSRTAAVTQLYTTSNCDRQGSWRFEVTDGIAFVAPPAAVQTTKSLTTAVGTTAVRTTAAASTAVGTTAVGTTAVGTTAVGTTAVGTTAVGTTAVGTTAAASTAVGTTAAATTAGPVTTAAVGTTGVREPSVCKTFINKDWLGFDIGHVNATLTAQACCDSCSWTRGCNAFTWNRWTKRCWMKNITADLTMEDHPYGVVGVPCKNDTCYSYRSYANSDFLGSDVAKLSSVPSADACARACLNYSGPMQCNAFTYNTNLAKCFLKDVDHSRVTLDVTAIAVAGVPCPNGICPRSCRTFKKHRYVGATTLSTVNVPVVGRCCKACDGAAGCTGFNYNLRTKDCTLLQGVSEATGLVSDRFFHSGKPCAANAGAC